MVAVSDDIYAGVPFQYSSAAHPIMIRIEELPANDTTGAMVKEVKERPWTISVPVWIPGYTGRFTVGGVEVGGEPDGDFLDRLFSSELALDLYFVGLINYKWQHWDFQANIFGGTIGSSTIFTLNDKTVVNASLDMMIPSIYAAYDFLYKSAPLGPITNWQVYLGGRLYFVDIDVIWPADLGIREERTSWLTFILGTHIAIKIIERIKLLFTGDIGGFVGSGAPNLFGSAAVNYRPWDLFSVNLGYAAMHIDRIRDNPQDIGFKADLAGPVMGIAFHF